MFCGYAWNSLLKLKAHPFSRTFRSSPFLRKNEDKRALLIINKDVTCYPGLVLKINMSHVTLKHAAVVFRMPDGNRATYDESVYKIGYLAHFCEDSPANPGFWRIAERIKINPILGQSQFVSYEYIDKEDPKKENPETPETPEKEINYSEYEVPIERALSILSPSLPFQFRVKLERLLEIRPTISYSDFLDRCVELMLNTDISMKQKIIETLDLIERSRTILYLLEKELTILEQAVKLERRLEKDAPVDVLVILRGEKEKLEKQLDRNANSNVIDKFSARIQSLVLPKHVAAVVSEEMEKLKSLDPMVYEYSQICDYLDWLTILPWGKYTKDNFDIKHARVVLDEEHYGLKDVKERILEFIATGAMTGSVQGKILCFTGPPGTGKTSVARSIATTLNRKFYRFSVGGMADPAEIKGHRRTYVASRAGKLINGLKQTGSSNPVFLIDEIDKIGRDPANCLLEALDPAQNSSFLDLFLDVHYDLSNVLFICTANDPSKITPPLLDRMEVIPISGYIFHEKMKIAQLCLVPTEIERIGLQKNTVVISNEAMSKLISLYCNEPGVRSLKKHIQRIFSKACLMMAREQKTSIQVDLNNFEEFINASPRPTRRYYHELPPGVAIGLVNTYAGGMLQYVECTNNYGEKDKKLKTTGSMGEVISESTYIAYTYARNFLSKLDPKNSFFEKQSLHIHFPTGSTPKDGPAAGVAIVTALLSWALHRPVRNDVATAGEITLSGKILDVTGIKEKVITIQALGIKELILPQNNHAEWEELDLLLKEGILAHFVENYEQVYNLLFLQEKEPLKQLGVDPKVDTGEVMSTVIC